jgi:hypothetical protein
MQPRPGRFAEAPFLRNGHKIAKVPERQSSKPVSHYLAELRSLCETGKRHFGLVPK